MFHGLSAFPLTPVNENEIDEAALAGLIQQLVTAGVDSIGVLGSTGSYAYLSRDERRRVLTRAVAEGGDIPVMAGIGALRTREVLQLADDAQQAGAQALLLAPVSYQPLTEEEVFTLFADVSRASSLPICVYDNPGTTHFTFSDELHQRIAQFHNVASIKIPGGDAAQRAPRLRALLPATVSIGVSGDAFAVGGLTAGCDLWYSVLGGLFPTVCLPIARAALAGDGAQAQALSHRLAPLWALFSRYGSIRVVATLARRLGYTNGFALPRPLLPLDDAGNRAVEDILPLLVSG